MTNSRKIAIKNLKGSDEEMRVSWMLKNMNENKTFKYLIENEKLENHNILLKSLQERYKTYRSQWRGNAKFAIKNNLDGEVFNVSSGELISLGEVALLVQKRTKLVLNFTPEITFNDSSWSNKGNLKVISNKKLTALGFNIKSDMVNEIDRLLFDCHKWFGK